MKELKSTRLLALPCEETTEGLLGAEGLLDVDFTLCGLALTSPL